MTLDEMLLSLSHKSGISDAAASSERLFLVVCVNDAARQFLQDTHLYIVERTLNLEAGVDQYLLSDKNLAMLDYVSNAANTVTLPLAIKPARDVLWDRARGNVGTARQFALLGSNMIVVSPTPSDAESWRLYAVPDFTDFQTGDGTIPIEDRTNIPVWALRGVEAYALMLANEKNQSFNAVQYYQGVYDREVGDTRRKMRKMGGRRLPAGSVGYPDVLSTGRALSRNDVYPSW